MEATSIDALVAQLAEDNPRWRAEAETRLVRHGAAAVPALVDALHSPLVCVRVHAAQALGNLSDVVARMDARANVAAALVERLVDSDSNGAAAIAAERALTQLGDAAVPALLRCVGTPSGPRALRAVGVIAPKDDSTAEAIRTALTTGDAATRTQAAVALLLMVGADAIGATAPLLSDPDKWVRYGVAEPLARLGVRRAKPVLDAACADEDEGPWLKGWADALLSELDDAERNGVARD